ncbi:hypothetical protein BMS3Bbin02_00300 [bacterium BMS3Bbin02]|nr:hypothetical protein BMS3Bbin02_00300 [bacterium BMS3Bbin02]
MTLRRRIAERVSVAESAVGLGVALGDPEDPRDSHMVRGASVWAPRSPITCAVTTSPNWFGVVDRVVHPQARVVCLDAMSAVIDLFGESTTEATDVWPRVEVTRAALRDTRRLAGALVQIRGVALPWGTPIGGWFSVRTPIPSTAWERWTSFGKVDPPPPSLAPFLPGIVRVVPDPGTSVGDYAASFQEFVRGWHSTSVNERLP